MKRLLVLLVVGLSLISAVGTDAQRADPRARTEWPEAPERAKRPLASAPTGEVSLRGVPRLVKFSGVVRNSLGEPRTGVVGILFALYEEQEGGAPLWLETQNVTLDEQGRYTVLLGATRSEGLPLELFASGEARWLGIQVQGEAEQPRILLVSVPYALKAEEAERLAGRTASDFVSAERLREEVQAQVAEEVRTLSLEPKTLSSGGGPAPAIVEGPSTFTGSNATELVLVTQNGTGFGLRAVAQSNVALYGDTSGAANIGVLGYARSLTGTTQGVRGQADSATGIGVFGLAPATTGANYGVRGQTNSTAGTAVFGVSLATTGGTFGVRGETFSTNASSIAVFGLARATTGAVNGVRGQTSSTSGIGVYGLSLASTGATTGLLGDVRSAAGTAVVAHNMAGGLLIRGLAGASPGTQVFSVDSSGNINASGTVTATAFAGSGAGLTGVGDITAVNTVAGGGLAGGAASGDANLTLLTSCGAGQLLKWSGAAWGCAVDIDTNSGGTVTSVASGAGLTGGPIVTSGTLSLDTAFTDGRYAQLAAANTFAAAQTMNSTLRVNGAVGIGAASIADRQLYITRSGSEPADNFGLYLANQTTTSGTAAKYGAFVQNTGAVSWDSWGGRIENSSTNTTADGAFKFGLEILSTGSFPGAGGASTRNWGLLVSVGGADENYAAAFTGGNVGIGTSAPGNILTVVQGSTTDPIADAWTVYSSRRWKTNIQTLAGALAKVEQLRGVSYQWKANGRADIGLIAEEVGEVVPEVVAYEEGAGDTEGPQARSVDYARLTALLIEAVKEQQAQIRALQAEIASLKATRNRPQR